jgi:hypothetical protein
MSGQDWLIVSGSRPCLLRAFWLLIVGAVTPHLDMDWLIEGSRRLFGLVSGWLD